VRARHAGSLVTQPTIPLKRYTAFNIPYISVIIMLKR
jgi:hypothetical protein